MFSDDFSKEPLSSFQFPIGVLSVEPDDTPLETVCINTSWLELLRGCAKQLLQDTTWDTDDINDLNLALQRANNLIDLLQDDKCVLPTFPTGSVICFAGSSLPDGWLFCDGTAVSRTTYGDLFSAIGTEFGSGNGVDTFNLPDFKQRVAGGVDSSAAHFHLGTKNGAWNTKIDVGNLPSHHHREDVYYGATPFHVAASTKTGSGSGSGYAVQGFAVTGAALVDQNTGDTGGDGNLPIEVPTLAINFMIKT